MNASKCVAQVGLGYWGKNILRDLRSLGVLHTACDNDLSAIELRKADFPDVRYTDSFDEILQDDEIRAVAISSPASTHFGYVKQALLAGKDVFVEKPLALMVNEAEELVAMAERRGRILMVGHILRYHPAVIKLKEFIASGRIGRLQYIYSNRLNIGKLRTEENILWSFAPHDISVIMTLVGDEPVRVTSMGGDYVSMGIMDTTMTTLEFENGVKGHIFVSWLHPFKEQKLVVVGSKCMAVFDDQSDDKLVLYSHEIEWKEGKIPVANKAVGESIPLEDKKPLYEELRHFVECVHERRKPLTDGREGLAVLRVLDRAENQLERSRNGALTDQRVAPALTPDYFVHESAYVDDGATVGRGSKIWHFSHILKGAVIGEGTIVGQNVMVGSDVVIGRGCKIQNNVSVYKGVTLEEEVFCGPSCVFTNVYNPRAFVERKSQFLPTLVKRGAMIGANATIVCGVTIGPYAVIGAGAVVKEDVPAHAVVAGVPAKQRGWACRCGAVLGFDDDSAACGECNDAYRLEGDALLPLER